MSKEKKSSCASISIILKKDEDNITIIHNSQNVYDGPYSSDVIHNMLIESGVTISPETTDSIVGFLDELEYSNNRSRYFGCLVFCFLILTVVTLVCYGLGHLIISLF